MLLLPLWVAGQTKVDTTSQFHCPDLAKKLDSSRIAYTSYFSMDKAIDYRIAELLTEYEKDCYNDSTQVMVYVNPNTEKSDSSYTLMAGWNELIWKHKEPTFADFIKWLKTKNK